MKKYNKYIKVGVIACLAIALLIASLWGGGDVVAAPARMSGVQKVINNIDSSNPFIFAEIVPKSVANSEEAITQEWFSEQVFEAEDGIAIRKITTTPKHFEEIMKNGGIPWDRVGLLYLNDYDSNEYKNTSDQVVDFSEEALIDIYNNVLEYNIPTILEDRTSEKAEDTNICKLAYLLKANDETIKVGSVADIESALTQAQEKIEQITIAEGVNKNVYFTVDLMDKDLEENITDFYGEDEVITEFQNESFYHEANGSSESMAEKGTGDTFNISRASLIKYIIHKGNQEEQIAKNAIRVLDIEPTRYSVLDEKTIYGWLGLDEEQQEALKIEIVQTTTAAFNGDMTDLVESYDLIYIGSYMGPSMADGTPVGGALNYKNGSTVYNNEFLNGLIYSDEGDSVEVNLGEDTDSSEIVGTTTKYSGNDISVAKKDALMEYANNGYPVVISDDLYESNTQKIDVKRVKATSEMYAFMKAFTVEKNANNVMKQGNIQSVVLNKYINLAKISLVVSQKPNEYVEGSAEDSSTLQYVFEFTDDTRVANEDMFYKLQLYVDSDADGQCSSYEEIQNLQLTDLEWNQVEKNQIKPDQKYIISVGGGNLHEGFISWKLQVSLFDEDKETCLARNSESGYTFIKAEKKKINVMQLTVEEKDSFMSSEKIKKYIDEVSYEGLYDIQVESLNVVEFLQTFNSVEEFSNFLKQYDLLVVGFAEDYCGTSLELVNDSESRISMVFFAMEEYVEAGRPLLLSQDTTTYKDMSDNPWGSALNKFVRNVAGMDRYRIVNTSSESGNNISGKEGYTNTLLDAKIDSSKATEVYHSLSYSGVTAAEATGISQVNKGMITSFPYDLNLAESTSTTVEKIVNNDSVMKLSGIQDVRVMNPTIQTIAATRAQDYQLDLDYDNDGDGKSDVVVWYALAGGSKGPEAETSNETDGAISIEDAQGIESEVALIEGNAYSIMPNDVRNNYFIYSLGNVTYTGQGYSSELSDYEAKLFVNTLISAYNLGIKPPTVNVLNDKEDTKSIIHDIYRVFDEEAGIFCETDQDIYFHVKDSNVIDGSKKVTINAYYEVAPTDAYDKMITDLNGEPIYLRSFEVESEHDQEEIDQILDSTQPPSDGETPGDEPSDELPAEGHYYVDDHVYELTVGKDKMNSVLGNNPSMKIYIGVQVDYNHTSGRTDSQETYAILEIKKMSLFNLD